MGHVEAMEPTAFERLGGEEKLRAIIDDFVDRIYGDIMIGFFFHGVNRERLRAMEFQLAAELLGSSTRYTGRPLDQAHARHPIMGGQFARRNQILKETLVDHGVAEDVTTQWLAHNERLRPLITGQSDHVCISPDETPG